MTRSLSLWSFWSLVLGLVGSVGLVGCADETAILVSVDGSAFSVPAQIDGLRFVITGSESGAMGDYTASLDGTWPQTLAIRRESASLQEEIVIQVLGLSGNTAQVQRVVRSTFSDGRTVNLDVILEAACFEVMCAASVDCLAGRCVTDSPMDAGTDMGVSDAGDAGVDPDSGVVDGGPDMPVIDGGPDMMMVDAGDDAPMVDAGDDAPILDAGDDAPPVGDGTLIISEYVESGNTKVLEFYNASDVSIDLATCEFGIYRNCRGDEMPTTYSDLVATSTMLAPGEVFVLCYMGLPACDALHPSLNFSGNDGLEIRCGGTTVVDTFGSATCSGEPWATTTFRRNAGIVVGDLDVTDSFPGPDWTEAAFDTSNLGMR